MIRTRKALRARLPAQPSPASCVCVGWKWRIAAISMCLATVRFAAGSPVVCWGDNENGQTTVPSSVASSGYAVLAVAAGYEHTCVLLDYGRIATGSSPVVCWGDNT